MSLIKKIVILSFISFLTACQTDASTEHRVYPDDLKIMIASDIHYFDDSLFNDGLAFENQAKRTDGRLLQYNADISLAFVDEVKKENPDILILSGDLTQNGEKISHLNFAKLLQKIEDETDTEVFVINGNHDVQIKYAASYLDDKAEVVESISAYEFSIIYQNFGYDHAYSKDLYSLSYLSKINDKLYLLMLDSNIYDRSGQYGLPYAKGSISKKTQEWIKSMADIADENGARIITVMHHNLIKHNSNFNAYSINERFDLYDLFSENNLNLVFSGHIHIQNIAQLEINGTLITDIASGSLMMPPFQYGILKTSQSGFDYQRQTMNISAWAQENNLSDENLLDYENYAAEFFYQSNFLRSSRRLRSKEVFTEEQISLMADLNSKLNSAYFAGDVFQVIEEYKDSEAYQLWLNVDPELDLDTYLRTMINSIGENHYTLHID